MKSSDFIGMSDGYLARGEDCIFCKNRFRERFDEKGRPYCKAFGVIPLKIWTGEISHRRPIKDDNGIQFEDIREMKLIIERKPFYPERFVKEKSGSIRVLLWTDVVGLRKIPSAQLLV